MKTKIIKLSEKVNNETNGGENFSKHRAKAIMQEEGIEYTQEELVEVLEFISKVVSITTHHYERLNAKGAKIISINTTNPNETKSLSIHSSKYGRTG